MEQRSARFDLTWQAPSFGGIVGCARRDITPPPGIRARNWGAATSDVAGSVHNPLTLTALAVSGPDREQAYLVSLDLGWWRAAADEALVRGRVRAALGCGEDRLLLHLIHTHAGPSVALAEQHLDGGELIPPYLDHLVQTIVDACCEARQNAAPAQLSWGVGSCPLAVHRNLRVDGREVVGFTPGVAADDSLLVGKAVDPTGRCLATLVNYACHPTSLGWGSNALSPDWIGAAREVVESHTAAPCLVLQGASGELSPRAQYAADPSVADRNGRAVGYAALSVLECLPQPGRRLRLVDVVESGAPLGVWAEEVAPGPSRLTTMRVDVELAARREADTRGLLARFSGVDPHVVRERVRRAHQLRAGYVEGGVARHPVWVWRIGDAALVAHPGEAHSPLQTELRRRHPELAVMVLNCTNGPGFVYLPPREAYRRAIYQVWQTQLAPGCLEALIDAADAALHASAEGVRRNSAGASEEHAS